MIIITIIMTIIGIDILTTITIGTPQ